MGKHKLCSRIRACDLKPGFIETNERIIWKNLNKKQKTKLKKKIKSGKIDEKLVQRY